MTSSLKHPEPIGGETKIISLNIPQLGLGDWWIEAITHQPDCIYYFGPFGSCQEADDMRPGYIEDLAAEGTQFISVMVKRCHPAQVTVFDDGQL